MGSLCQGQQIIRLLDLLIASDILAHIKPHNSNYPRFSLNLSNAANLLCDAKAYVLIILYADVIIEVK